MEDKVQAKLRKLLALAERGEGGEKDNARRMFDKLLAKHGMTIEDLSKESRETHWFPARSRFEVRLAGQIMAKILDTMTPDIWTSRGRPKQVGVDVTPSEAIEFELHYEALRRALTGCFQDAFSAFIQANRLFASAQTSGYDAPSDRDFAILAMASGITPTQVSQRLEHRQEVDQ